MIGLDLQVALLMPFGLEEYLSDGFMGIEGEQSEIRA
jgi:hypothetical protein